MNHIEGTTTFQLSDVVAENGFSQKDVIRVVRDLYMNGVLRSGGTLEKELMDSQVSKC